MISGVVLLLVIAVGISLISNSTSKSSTVSKLVGTKHVITGTMTITDGAAGWTDGSECDGTDGYDDIAAGTSVTIEDGSGKIIATGELRDGTAEDVLVGDTAFSCALPFTVTNVPDADFYQIELAHRGALNFSKADLAGQDWDVSMTLGS